MAESILRRLMTETWPARMAQSALSALMYPGEVYQSQTPVTTGQMVGPATDLAGLVIGGGIPAAERGAVGMAGGKLINPATRAYHATDRSFNKFSRSAVDTGMSIGTGQKAHWFTSSPDVADTYLGGAWVNRAKVPNSADLGSGVGRYYSEGSQVYPVNIDDSGFIRWDMGGAGYNEKFVNAAIKEARKEKAPGVAFENMRDPGIMGLGRGESATSYAVLKKGRIKSAFGDVTLGSGQTKQTGLASLILGHEQPGIRAYHAQNQQ